jgi:hypothetical protein
MRFLGWSLLGLALVLALYLGVGEPLGAALFRLDAALLNTAQAGLQRHVAPWAWNDVVLPVIERPAWFAPAVLGAVFLVLGRVFRRA